MLSALLDENLSKYLFNYAGVLRKNGACLSLHAFSYDSHIYACVLTCSRS
jgi:hypothetical protein